MFNVLLMEQPLTIDLSWVIDLITSVGFPIACCVGCFIVILEMNKAHKSEIKGFTDALNKNTLALTELVRSIDTMQAVLLSLKRED